MSDKGEQMPGPDDDEWGDPDDYEDEDEEDDEPDDEPLGDP